MIFYNDTVAGSISTCILRYTAKLCINVTWRNGLSIVGGPIFYIVDNQATITIAATENARLGQDGFAVAARTTGD